MRRKRQQGVRVGAGKTTPRFGPLSYCAYAVDYLDAARAAGNRDRRFKPAQAYMACHAIELALIAYLSVASGQTEPGLRMRNLWNLLLEAESRGLARLARLTPAQRGQVRKAARYFSESVFEYPSLAETIRGHPGAPDVRPLLSAAAVLVAAARKAMQPDTRVPENMRKYGKSAPGRTPER